MESHDLAEIANRYRREGYDVVVAPDPDQVPDFLAGFHPDLIATRGDEGVVVDIKVRRADLAADPRVIHLAKALDAKPGWRLDTIVLERESPLDRAIRDAVEPSNAELSQMLDSADDLAAKGYTPYAYVVAWAGLEAAMRRLRDEAWPSDRPSPTEMVGVLYSNGFLTLDQFRRLRDSDRIRSQVVHGLVSPNVDAETVRYLTETARHLAEAGGMATVSG